METKGEAYNKKSSNDIQNLNIIMDIFNRNNTNIENKIKKLCSDNTGQSNISDNYELFELSKTFLKYLISKRDEIYKNIEDKQKERFGKINKNIEDNYKFIKSNEETIKNLKEKNQKLLSFIDKSESLVKTTQKKKEYYCDICQNKKFMCYKELHDHYIKRHIVKTTEDLSIHNLINNYKFDAQINEINNQIKKDFSLSKVNQANDLMDEIKVMISENQNNIKDGIFKNDLLNIKKYLEFISINKDGISLEDVEKIENEIRNKCFLISNLQRSFFQRNKEKMNEFIWWLFNELNNNNK